MDSPAITFQRAQIYLLKRKIAAVRLAKDVGPRLGFFTELPESIEVEVCGAGFSETTLKVRHAGEMYFVFGQDLEL